MLKSTVVRLKRWIVAEPKTENLHMCVYLPELLQRGKSKERFQARFSAQEGWSLEGKDKLTSPV